MLTLGPRDAVRVPPGTPRACRNDGWQRATLLMVSRRTEDLRQESVPHPGLWRREG